MQIKGGVPSPLNLGVKYNVRWRISQNRIHRKPYHQSPSPAQPKPNRTPHRKAPRIQPLIICSEQQGFSESDCSLRRLPQFAKKPHKKSQLLRLPYHITHDLGLQR